MVRACPRLRLSGPGGGGGNSQLPVCRQVAMKRVRELTDLDLDAEAAKPSTNGLMWAVFAAFLK